MLIRIVYYEEKNGSFSFFFSFFANHKNLVSKKKQKKNRLQVGADANRKQVKKKTLKNKHTRLT